MVLIIASFDCCDAIETSPVMDLDLNDILRADLMPTTFLMLDSNENIAKVNDDDEDPFMAVATAAAAAARQGGVELGAFSNPSNQPNATALHLHQPPAAVDTVVDGNIMNALQTMRFHR